MKFRIENMTCGGCVRSVSKTVQKIDPEARIDADLDGRSIEITSAHAPAEFSAALDAAGYPARAA